MRDAFLQAILESPDEDAPRLIFADWLLENGDENDRRHAELIRLQCRLAAGVGRAEDEREQRDLIALHSQTWGAPLKALLGLPAEATPWQHRPPSIYGDEVPYWEFRRGFIEKLSLSADELLRHARELFRLAPLRHLRVTERVERPAKFFALRQLAHLTHLELPNAELKPAAARRLAGCSHLANLTALTINAPTMVGSDWSKIGPEGARALAESPHLTRLTSLHLPGNQIGPEGVAALVGSRWRLARLNLSRNDPGDEWGDMLTDTNLLSSLLWLNLSGNDLSPESIDRLASCPHLANLTGLDLEENRFGPEGARALARSPHLLNLRSLNLEMTSLADEGLTDLVASPGLASLTSLNLGDSKVTADGLAALLASRLRLRRLNCSCCELGDTAGELLAASPMLASLRDINFKGNEWTARAVRALVAAPGLALTELDLGLNTVGDEGALALASCRGLAGLRSLWLGSFDDEDEVRIGDVGAKALAAGPWVGLEELDLSYNVISDEGARALARSDVLAGLHRLNVSSPLASFGEEGRAALRARFGNRVRL